MALCLALVLSIASFAQEAPEGYVEGEDTYTVYTDAQYQEVIKGVYDKTLENKTIVFGCDILVTLDFVMENPCDITIDLNGFTYTNKTVNNKSGDFDFQNENAIIRIKNGNISSNFCVFIFRTSGQLYAEEINVVSNDECIYRYGGGHSAVVNLKNCKMDALGNYYSVTLNGSCGGYGGTLYEIDGGEYAGLCIMCPVPGSYVKNCLVYEKKLNIDAWHAHGENNSYVTLEVRNVIIEGDGGEVYLNDVAVEPELYDCTFQKINLSNKSYAFIMSYTSPTCEKAGTKTKYHNLTSITVDEQYSLDNPALGHVADLGNILDLVYENGFINNGTYVCSCERCGAENVKEESPSAQSLLLFTGISTEQNGNGICIGYMINKEAIDVYEGYGKTFELGVVAYVPNGSETNLELVNNDLSAIDRTISVPISTETRGFEFKIKGFAAKYYDLALVMCAYVYDGTKVDYVNVSINGSSVSLSQDDYATTLTMKQICEFEK